MSQRRAINECTIMETYYHITILERSLGKGVDGLEVTGRESKRPGRRPSQGSLSLMMRRINTNAETLGTERKE